MLVADGPRQYFVGKGLNTFRVPFQLERLIPPAGGLTGSLDATYLSGLTTTVNYITGKGAYAVIERAPPPLSRSFPSLVC